MLNLCVKCYITLCGGFRRLFIQYRCLSECASSFQSHGCNASGIHIHVLDISLASDRCDVIGRTRKKFCPLWNSTSPSPVLDNGLGPAADLGLPACPHPVCFVLLAQRKGNIGFPAHGMWPRGPKPSPACANSSFEHGMSNAGVPSLVRAGVQCSVECSMFFFPPPLTDYPSFRTCMTCSCCLSLPWDVKRTSPLWRYLLLPRHAWS